MVADNLFREAVAAPWVLHFYSKECRREEHQEVEVCYRSCTGSDRSLDIARGRELVISAPSKEITKGTVTTENFSNILSWLQYVGSVNVCQIRKEHGMQLREVSKKPATQSHLATEFSNCLHRPDETFEPFINRLNDSCQRSWRSDEEDSSHQGYMQRICCICPD